MTEPIYLDHHATTPVDQRVIDEMLPFLTEKFGNIASNHCFGKQVRAACDQARNRVASLIGAKPDELVFTSGATESDNLAIKGVAEYYKDVGRHIVTCKTEHKAVLDTCAYLEKCGFEVTYLPVDEHGRLAPSDVCNAVRTGKKGTVERTILVSLMGANNEIGTIHPIKRIGEDLEKFSDVIFHVDGAQTAGKIPVHVKNAHIDLLSISAHKIYGPKGIGALYISKDKPIKIVPQMHGGGQESGYRAGTLAVPLIVGLGKAAALAEEHMVEENARLKELRDHLQAEIEKLTGVIVNGHPVERLPGNLNVTILGVDSEALMLGMKDVAISSTSACSSSAQAPSHVLRAIGRSVDEAFSSVRFGLGRLNTRADIDYALKLLVNAVQRYRVPATFSKANRQQVSL